MKLAQSDLEHIDSHKDLLRGKAASETHLLRCRMAYGSNVDELVNLLVFHAAVRGLCWHGLKYCMNARKQRHERITCPAHAHTTYAPSVDSDTPENGRPNLGRSSRFPASKEPHAILRVTCKMSFPPERWGGVGCDLSPHLASRTQVMQVAK